MKFSAVHFVWLLLLGALVFGAVGCASDDPENESVRPWNTPQGWEGAMPVQSQEHSN